MDCRAISRMGIGFSQLVFEDSLDMGINCFLLNCGWSDSV